MRRPGSLMSILYDGGSYYASAETRGPTLASILSSGSFKVRPQFAIGLDDFVVHALHGLHGLHMLFDQTPGATAEYREPPSTLDTVFQDAISASNELKYSWDEASMCGVFLKPEVEPLFLFEGIRLATERMVDQLQPVDPFARLSRDEFKLMNW